MLVMQAGAWQRVKDESEVLRQIRGRLITSRCLIDKIATGFCRDGQLERPGDVIREWNRRIRATQVQSSSVQLCGLWVNGQQIVNDSNDLYFQAAPVLG